MIWAGSRHCEVILLKEKGYVAGMWIAMVKKYNMYWVQVSPNYTYRKCLEKWCEKNNYKIIGIRYEK